MHGSDGSQSKKTMASPINKCKHSITGRFIQAKRAEYDALRAELDQLTAEAEAEGLL